MTLFGNSNSKEKSQKLKKIFESEKMIVMPGCYDALSAKLIERAGIKAGFMSGFCVSSSKLGMPDTGLITYSEMQDQVKNISNITSIPILFDGDTGWGNAANIYRTVRGYADAGAAAVMIEDQKWPKRCGHTKGKDVVDLDEAKLRIKAAVDASKLNGKDILIMARTDAIATKGLSDAIKRMQIYKELGADLLFVEAIKNEEDMKKQAGTFDFLLNTVPVGLSDAQSWREYLKYAQLPYQGYVDAYLVVKSSWFLLVDAIIDSI